MGQIDSSLQLRGWTCYSLSSTRQLVDHLISLIITSLAAQSGFVCNQLSAFLSFFLNPQPSSARLPPPSAALESSTKHPPPGSTFLLHRPFGRSHTHPFTLHPRALICSSFYQLSQVSSIRSLPCQSSHIRFVLITQILQKWPRRRALRPLWSRLWRWCRSR